MKRTITIALAIIVALIITGCGTPTEKSEEGIQADIASSEWYIHNFPNYSIQKVEIIKRQTDAENFIDKVFAVATISNEDESVLGNIDILVEYGLYNDGWIMDSCEIDYEGQNHGAYFFPQKELNLSDEEIAQALTNLTGTEWENIEVYAKQSDLNAGVEEYSLTASEAHKYMVGYIDATIAYSFAGSAGYWMPYLIINSEYESWNIDGSYYHAEYDRYLDIRYNDCCVINYVGSDGRGGKEVVQNVLSQTLSPFEIRLNELFANYAYHTSNYSRSFVEDGYQVKVNSDFGFDYYDCDYVIFDSYGSAGPYDFLFIGKDFIAAEGRDVVKKRDDYNKTMTIQVSLLEKVS